MSKPQSRPKTPDPYAPPPKQTRKVSQQKTPKFYDGPTVAGQAQDLKGKAKDAAATSIAQVKRQGSKVAETARRHPWSIASLITTLPFLIVLSLFSTVVCPPPNESLSPVSRFVLAPLGLHDSSSQHSALHQTFCYPANVYHKEVLQPYVYPVVNDLQARAIRHPLYKSGLEPAYQIADVRSRQAWSKAQPVVERVKKTIRKVYLTWIDPHVPYIRTKIHTLTAPYTSRIAALHNAHVAPHINTASKYAQSARKSSVDNYNYLASHPLTGQAQKYAGHGYRFSRAKGQQAYTVARPHAIRAGREAERISREILGPRAIQTIQWGSAQAAKGWAVIRSHVVRLYYAHLDPHVGPHLAKANVALSPYTQAFRKQVFTPYILPALEYVLPPAIIAAPTPRSFWSIISDILPSLDGGHVAEHKGQMDNYYEKVNKAQKPAAVPVPNAEKIAKAESVHATNAQAKKAAKKFDRAEMNEIREAIHARVEEQGKRGVNQVREELVQFNSEIIADEKRLQGLRKSGKDEIERDFDYVLKGLDKLYTSSTTLTRDQVAKSSVQGDARVSKKVQGVKERLERMRAVWIDQGKEVIDRNVGLLNEAMGTEYVDLKIKMNQLDDIAAKDLAAYHAIKESADGWTKKYYGIYRGETNNRALNAPSANINKACNNLVTELDDMVEAWRERVSVLKRTALDRIEAREALAMEEGGSPSTVRAPVAAAKSAANDGRVSILPIVEAGAGAAAAAGGIIGKGKDQILDALSQASDAAIGAEATGTGVINQAKSAADSAVSAASSGVHDATRAAQRAVGATPSPEGAAEHLESVLGNVAQGYASVAEQLESSVQDATRAVQRAVGAEPTAEGVVESAQSIAADVSASISSVASDISASAASAADAAGSVVHDGTRSAIKAVGATPSPETPGEHAESVLSVVSASGGSVFEQVSSVVHDATRSAAKAVGVTPSPESLGEHAESIAAAVSASAAEAAASASSVLHDATRSAARAVGVTPSPETPGEYVESIVDAASSVYDQAGSSVSSVVDQAASSASSVYDEVTSTVGDAGAAITDQASALALQIQDVLGLVSTPEPLASTASSYLAGLSGAAATALPEALSSGSSILASLQSQASASVHQATRAASRAAGLKPTPETPQEKLERIGEAYTKVAELAENMAKKQASQVVSQVGEVTEGVKKLVKDEL